MSAKRASPKSNSATTAPCLQQLAVFGSPLLLEGEDTAAYDALQTRIGLAIGPVDIIDEIFVNDVIALQWEILRWRRLKWSLVRARGLAALERFVGWRLDYELLGDEIYECVVDILKKSLAKDQPDKAAQEIALDNILKGPDASNKISEIITAAGHDWDEVVQRARANKAEVLVRGYERGEQKSVKLVNKFLDLGGRSVNTFMEGALAEKIDDIERIDRLTTIAETRRNACLREIDRRRATLGEALRRSVQEVEDVEFEEIEAPPKKRKSGA